MSSSAGNEYHPVSRNGKPGHGHSNAESNGRAGADAFRASALYALAAGGCLLLTALILTNTGWERGDLPPWLLAGAAFVAATSTVMFVLLRRLLARHEAQARSQAETAQAIRGQADQLAQAQRLARLGSWHWDRATNQTRWSDACCEIFGVPPGSLDGSPNEHFHRVHPDDRARVEAMGALAGQQDRLEDQYRIVRPDGEVRHLQVLAEVQLDDDGRPMGWIGSLQDVTERALVALELEKRNRQQASIARLGLHALGEFSLTAIMNDAMAEAARVLGVKYTGVTQWIPEQNVLRLIAGIGWLPERIGRAEVPLGTGSHAGYTFMVNEPVIVEDMRTETRFHPHQAMLEQGAVSGISTVIRGPDGPWGVLGAHSVDTHTFTEADLDFLQNLANLISEVLQRDRTARALQEGDMLRRIASEAAALGGWTVERATRKPSWSQEVRRILEVAPEFEPGPGEGITFYAPEHQARIQQMLDECLAHGTPFDEELQLITARGRRLWVRTIGRPELDSSGDVVRVRGAIQDISERKALEGMLHQSQRLEAVGKLTGGVAHDFNNLLTVIVGNAEHLVEATRNDPRLNGMALTTLRAALRGADLTRALLAYARQQPLTPKPTRVDELLAAMDQLLKRSLGEKIDVQVVTPTVPWPALVDPAQLEAAILNLCLNARDAMPGGGQLRIELDNVVLDEAAAASSDVAPGDYVVIAISDSGVGVAPELVERVFEPFFTTKPAGQGSGLGLSMVYGFARQSNGHVKIDSVPGRGTTIRLYLPSCDQAVPAPAPTPAPDKPAGGRETVLLVEDDDLVRRFVTEQVDSLGYRVLAARNAAEGLELLKAEPDIDVLFTDVVMPGEMDGPALATAAKALRPELPVLFTSGYTEDSLVLGGQAEPGVALLTKPYRLTELAEKLRAVLDAARTGGS